MQLHLLVFKAVIVWFFLQTLFRGVFFLLLYFGMVVLQPDCGMCVFTVSTASCVT